MENQSITWPKIGNDKAISFLEKTINSDSAAGSYLFLGPDDLGKSTIALAFARNLMKISLGEETSFNSDLHVVEPEEGKKSITISQIRELIKALTLSSFLNSYKIGIIKVANKLTPEAQNAMLKTLEEPRDKVIIIMISSSEEGILDTISSRLKKIYFQPVPAETIYDYLISKYKTKRSLAKDLSSLSLGRPLKAVNFLENPEKYEKYKSEASLLLSLLTLDINDRLEILSNIFADKTYSALAINRVNEIIETLEGLWRDILLINFDSAEKIQHSFLKDELALTLESLNKKGVGSEKIANFLLGRFKLAGMAKEYLASNVNPRLVLEQLFINL